MLVLTDQIHSVLKKKEMNISKSLLGLFIILAMQGQALAHDLSGNELFTLSMLFLVPSIVAAIFFGIVVYRLIRNWFRWRLEMEKLKKPENRRRIPTVGKILILAFLGLACFVGGTFYVRRMGARELEQWRNDGGAMKNFLYAIESYATDYEGWCPPDLATLEVTADLPPSLIDRYDFQYFGSGKRWSKDGSAILPIIVTKPGIKKEEFILLGYNNGSVHFLHWAPAMIKDLFKQSQTAGKNGGD